MSVRIFFTQSRSNISWKDSKELRCYQDFCSRLGFCQVSLRQLYISLIWSICTRNTLSKCKIVKIKYLFKKGFTIEAKYYRLICLLI